KSGVFVVNFVPASWDRAILLCGSLSGRNADKFAASGIAKEESETVKAPRLAGSLGALECKVLMTVETGDHTLFVGEVCHKVLRSNAPRLHHLDIRMEKSRNLY